MIWDGASAYQIALSSRIKRIYLDELVSRFTFLQDVITLKLNRLLPTSIVPISHSPVNSGNPKSMFQSLERRACDSYRNFFLQ